MSLLNLLEKKLKIEKKKDGKLSCTKRLCFFILLKT